MSLTIKNFGSILKQLRYEKKITQKELSEKSGISKIQISKLENNIQKPKFFTIEKLAVALKVPIYLLAEPAGYKLKENDFPEEKTSQKRDKVKQDEINRKINQIIDKINSLDNKITGENTLINSSASEKVTKNTEIILKGINRVKKYPLLPDIISEKESLDFIETIVDDWIFFPEIYNIDADFVMLLKNNYMENYGFYTGMMVFIKKTGEFSSGDIVAISAGNNIERNIMLKKIFIQENNKFFFDGKGEFFNSQKEIEVIGRVVYKMDDPRKFQINFSNSLPVVKKIIYKDEEIDEEEFKDKEIATWNNRGIDLQDQGNYKEAIECYDKALKLDPNDTIVLNNKAFALEHMGNYDEAMECYNKAMSIDPEDELIEHNKEIFIKNHNNPENTGEGQDSTYWYNLKKDSVFDYEKIIKLYKKYNN